MTCVYVVRKSTYVCLCFAETLKYTLCAPLQKNVCMYICDFAETAAKYYTTYLKYHIPPTYDARMYFRMMYIPVKYLALKR